MYLPRHHQHVAFTIQVDGLRTNAKKRTKRATNHKNQTSNSQLPTTFLSLPRELRQRIFYLSCEHTSGISTRPILDPSFRTLIETCNESERKTLELRVESLEILWVRRLRGMDPLLQEDMKYVHKLCITDVERLCDRCDIIVGTY